MRALIGYSLLFAGASFFALRDDFGFRGVTAALGVGIIVAIADLKSVA